MMSILSSLIKLDKFSPIGDTYIAGAQDEFQTWRGKLESFSKSLWSVCMYLELSSD